MQWLSEIRPVTSVVLPPHPPFFFFGKSGVKIHLGLQNNNDGVILDSERPASQPRTWYQAKTQVINSRAKIRFTLLVTSCFTQTIASTTKPNKSTTEHEHTHFPQLQRPGEIRQAEKQEALGDLPSEDEQGHRQSDQQFNCSLGNTAETSEKQGGAHMGFCKRIDTILN